MSSQAESATVITAPNMHLRRLKQRGWKLPGSHILAWASLSRDLTWDQRPLDNAVMLDLLGPSETVCMNFAGR